MDPRVQILAAMEKCTNVPITMFYNKVPYNGDSILYTPHDIAKKIAELALSNNHSLNFIQMKIPRWIVSKS